MFKSAISEIILGNPLYLIGNRKEKITIKYFDNGGILGIACRKNPLPPLYTLTIILFDHETNQDWNLFLYALVTKVSSKLCSNT